MAEAAASEGVREDQEQQTNKTSLTALPTELLLRIFNPLDHDTSTCLGLTCKRLWAIHEDEQEREERTQYRIDNGICSKRPFGKFSQLPFLLREWMGSNMVYVDMGFFKFIKKRRYCRVIKRHQIRWGQRKKQSHKTHHLCTCGKARRVVAKICKRCQKESRGYLGHL